MVSRFVSPPHRPLATFVELPPFQRWRQDYLSDEDYRALQNLLLVNPEAGDVIQGSGGLRKVRFEDKQRGKGKRGGLRIIYYFWDGGQEFWMFTLYGKGEMADLSAAERKAFKALLENELLNRSQASKPSIKRPSQRGNP
ncbi:MAG: hypothetical protein RLZZ399_2184 [Verrucomicrobiota bacterium]|jgi:hypothetical protein